MARGGIVWEIDVSDVPLGDIQSQLDLKWVRAVWVASMVTVSAYLGIEFVRDLYPLSTTEHNYSKSECILENGKNQDYKISKFYNIQILQNTDSTAEVDFKSNPSLPTVRRMSSTRKRLQKIPNTESGAKSQSEIETTINMIENTLTDTRAQIINQSNNRINDETTFSDDRLPISKISTKSKLKMQKSDLSNKKSSSRSLSSSRKSATKKVGTKSPTTSTTQGVGRKRSLSSARKSATKKVGTKSPTTSTTRGVGRKGSLRKDINAKPKRTSISKKSNKR